MSDSIAKQAKLKKLKIKERSNKKNKNSLGILDSGTNESSDELEIESTHSRNNLNGYHKHGDSQKWKIVKTVRKCIYKVRNLNPGEIFGHDEFVDHFEKVLET